ncbi:MAG TPA: hypothetical protein VF221_10935 [Chloroflexota bacterium]
MTDQQSPLQSAQADSQRSWVGLEWQEARLVIIVGFVTGLSIGAFFLIYIVLAYVFGETKNFAPFA